MLTDLVADAEAVFFADLREREFSRLDTQRLAYLDYGGSALYAESHVRAHQALLSRGIFGNPHSEHAASTASTRILEDARRRVLRMLDAPAGEYVVCFTANATAAIKLVAEAYPFTPETPCILSADNHNSVNGVREYARRAGAPVTYLSLDDELRLRDSERELDRARGEGRGLLAFPAQSNFTGALHPLSLVRGAQARGLRVLLDAAAFLPAHALSLRRCPVDFLVLSFYKIFGYPTGLGALVARRDALAALDRPWFAGGTVDYASVQLDRHQLRATEGAFEDGTPNFLAIAALAHGFDAREEIGVARISAHVQRLTLRLLDGLTAARHPSGAPLVRLYGPTPVDRRGGAIAFNVLDRDGRVVPFGLVEDRANVAGVLLRGGCFCNPGAAEAAFRFDATRMGACLGAAGRTFSIPQLQRCLGNDVAVGALRASIGLANNTSDIDRCLAVVTSFAA